MDCAIEPSVLSTGLYRLNDGQCDSVPFRDTKFEGKFRLVSAFTPQSLDVITAGRSHGDLRYFWTVHNPIHATKHWSWIFPGERLLWLEIVVLVMEAADVRAEFRGGNYTAVLTGDSLWDSLWSFCPNSLMEYSRYFLIWLLSSPYSDFDNGPRTVTVVNVGASDEVAHNHVWLVIMTSMI